VGIRSKRTDRRYRREVWKRRIIRVDQKCIDEFEFDRGWRMYLEGVKSGWDAAEVRVKLTGWKWKWKRTGGGEREWKEKSKRAVTCLREAGC